MVGSSSPFGGIPSPQALFLEKCAPPSIGLRSLRSRLYSLIPLKVIAGRAEGSSTAQAGAITVFLRVYLVLNLTTLPRDLGKARKLPEFHFPHL